MKKIIIICAIIIPFMGASCRIMGNKSSQGEILAFSEFKSGQYCGIEEKALVVLNDPDDFLKFWRQAFSNYHPVPEMPEVDFGKKTIIGIFIGTISTGGYSVEITEIKEMRREIVVQYKINKPAPDDYVTMALSQPYQLVLISKTEKDIEFVIIE